MTWARAAAGALLATVIGSAVISVARTQEPQFDLVIRNGWIIDGMGNPGYKADLGIREGRIAAIGEISSKGKEEFDAAGKVVAPGFIDVHTHAENIVDLPNGENFVRMGVTSIVIGNCGGSEENLGSFFSGLEQKPVGVNVASLVGHNTVRRKAMGGNFNRPPTEAEMKSMQALVEQAMRDGAVGLSTGLIYLPGTYSKTEEIIELAKVSARFGGLYATHMRSESTDIFAAIDEMLRIGKESGSRVQYSHIKLGGEHMWGKHGDVLAKLEAARQEGLEITQDQYAYTASSTTISTLIPDDALEGGTAEFKKRIEDPAQKAKIIEFMKGRLATRKRTDYGYAVIARCNADARLNGKNLVEAAQIRMGGASLDQQIETVFWIQLNGGASAVFHGMSEPDVIGFMKHPNTMVASDSAARPFGEGIPHPRGYGNNARVLGRYVREQGVIRLEDAIRRMTSLPAQTFRFRDRGVLREGAWADVVVFDPKTVTDPSTYEKPHAYAVGFALVAVNGVAVVRNDAHTGKRPGVPIRRSGARAIGAVPGSSVSKRPDATVSLASTGQRMESEPTIRSRSTEATDLHGTVNDCPCEGH